MKTMAPAHAEQQLTHVADRFDHWRQTRTTRAEPIPQRLWEQAMALTTIFSIARRCCTDGQPTEAGTRQYCRWSLPGTWR